VSITIAEFALSTRENLVGEIKMSKSKGNDNKTDMNRRSLLKKSGPALAAAGVAAHMAVGTAIAQDRKSTGITVQTELNRSMIKAESAMSRIRKGIFSGLLDEVAAGAVDLEIILEDIAEIHGGSFTQQSVWRQRSVDAAKNAKMLYDLASAAMERGEKTVSNEIVELYAQSIRLATNCHNQFRVTA
jgi:hypothetical protein